MINNSSADCLITLKFGTEFHRVTSDILHMFKVNAKYEGYSTNFIRSPNCYCFLEIGVAESNGHARIFLGC